MIVSYSKRFIFIKTRKTAGSSVQHYLSQFLDSSRDIVTGMSEFEGFNWQGTPLQRADGTAWGHAPYQIVHSIDPYVDFSRFFTFTIERNPWDKVVSNWQFHNYKDNMNLSLEEFMQFPNNIPRDWDKYALGNKPQMHKVIKYENLEKELSEVCRRIGINFDNEDFANYKHKSGTREKRDYREYYTDITKRLVEGYFRNEIREFKYTFDGE